MLLKILPNKVLLNLFLDYNSEFASYIAARYSEFTVKNIGKNYTVINAVSNKKLHRCTSCIDKKFFNFVNLKSVYICYSKNKKKFCYSCPENIFLFDSLLRIICSIVLCWYNGIILHSAGIIKNSNSCEIYTGPSSSGKSTLAKKISATKIISDELCPVVVTNNKVVSYKSMFYSEVKPRCENKFYVVKKINFLLKEKSSKNIILTVDNIILMIMKNTFWVLNDESFSSKLLNIVYKIVSVLKTSGFSII